MTQTNVKSFLCGKIYYNHNSKVFLGLLFISYCLEHMGQPSNALHYMDSY